MKEFIAKRLNIKILFVCLYEGKASSHTKHKKINITHSFVFSNSGSLISKMITAIK
jgi:hypothetical protein